MSRSNLRHHDVMGAGRKSVFIRSMKGQGRMQGEGSSLDEMHQEQLQDRGFFNSFADDFDLSDVKPQPSAVTAALQRAEVNLANKAMREREEAQRQKESQDNSQASQ